MKDRTKECYARIEARRIIGEALGRPLTRNDRVEHLDGNPFNNELDNLSLKDGRPLKNPWVPRTDYERQWPSLARRRKRRR